MTRIPRPVYNGEQTVRKRADELTDEDYGRIVQHPGNRGWLQHASPDSGGVFINTTTGCATYPTDAEFIVWGFSERDFVRRQWRRAQGGSSRCPTCGKGYRTEVGYQRHIETHADELATHPDLAQE